MFNIKTISRDELDSYRNLDALKFLDKQNEKSGMEHPDIATALWEISKKMENGAVYKYGRFHILVEKRAKLILGIPFGTSYIIKTGEMFDDAVETGSKTVKTWSNGHVTDLAAEIGPDWVFGAWLKEEPIWFDLITEDLIAEE